jgi:hypothetical protein
MLCAVTPALGCDPGVGAIEIHADQNAELVCHGAPTITGRPRRCDRPASVGTNCDERNTRTRTRSQSASHRDRARGIGRSIGCRVIGLAEGPGVGILRGFGECSWPASA